MPIPPKTHPWRRSWATEFDMKKKTWRDKEFERREKFRKAALGNKNCQKRKFPKEEDNG